MRTPLRNTLLIASAVVAIHLLLFRFAPDLAARSARNGLRGLGEVLAIVPSILVLIALFDVWVPKDLVGQNLGPDSGLRGVALALLLGMAAAGPIYAAFPVGATLVRKGCRPANLVIFLGAWATIKVPMLLWEGAFLGLRFALLRLALTLPGIMACGFLVERIGCRLEPGLPLGDPTRP